jgi:hypothetical protein
MSIAEKYGRLVESWIFALVEFRCNPSHYNYCTCIMDMTWAMMNDSERKIALIIGGFEK